MKFGTPLAQFVQPFSPGQLDLLGSSISPAAALVSITATNVVNSYNAILVHVHNPGGATVGFAKWAQVIGPLTALQTFSGAFPSQPTVAAISLSDVQTIIGCANSPGDSLTVNVQFLAVPPAGTGIFVYGMTGPAPMLIRSEGRNYPEGNLIAEVITASGGGATLIPAPASTERILLKSLAAAANGGASGITCTISGNAGQSLLFSFNAVNFQDKLIPPDGLLLDPATAVLIAAEPGSTQVAVAIYDLVPA